MAKMTAALFSFFLWVSHRVRVFRTGGVCFSPVIRLLPLLHVCIGRATHHIAIIRHFGSFFIQCGILLQPLRLISTAFLLFFHSLFFG